MPAATPANAVRDAEQLLERGDVRAALTAWEAILARDPGAPRARGRVGACLLALGRHAEAGDLFSGLVAEMPGQPVPLYRLVRAGRPGRRSRSPRCARRGCDRRRPAGVRSGRREAFAALRGDDRFAAIRDRIARNDAVTADEAGFRTFDFWIGSWEARTEDGVLQGHNRIERVLGGAALVEHWTGRPGSAGRRYRYDRRAGTWRQTWVDDQGDITEFMDGRLADDALRSARATPMADAAASRSRTRVPTRSASCPSSRPMTAGPGRSSTTSATGGSIRRWPRSRSPTGSAAAAGGSPARPARRSGGGRGRSPSGPGRSPGCRRPRRRRHHS